MTLKDEETYLHFVRVNGSLIPSDEYTREMLESWDNHAAIRAEVMQKRTLERLRWWWGLCRIVLDNSSDFASLEDVSNSIKLGTGNVITTQVYEGGQWRIDRAPGSIAFRNMKEQPFRALCNRATRYVCSFLDVSNPQLADALQEYLEPPNYRRG